MKLISRGHSSKPVEIGQNLYALIEIIPHQAERYLNIMSQLRQMQEKSKMHINYLSIHSNDVSFYNAKSLFLPEFVPDYDPNFERVLKMFPEKKAMKDKVVKIFPEYIIFSGVLEGRDVEIETFELTQEALELIQRNNIRHYPSELVRVLWL